MNLSGNVVLITGGSRGIGLAFAHKLLDLGNEVIVTGRAQSTLDDEGRVCREQRREYSPQARATRAAATWW
jgi:short-subunit dehydrogenase involved in D-alanine esterification of teichoic acids